MFNTFGRGHEMHTFPRACYLPAQQEKMTMESTTMSTISQVLDAYGAYSSHDNEAGYDNFIRLIPEKGREQQLLFEL